MSLNPGKLCRGDGYEPFICQDGSYIAGCHPFYYLQCVCHFR